MKAWTRHGTKILGYASAVIPLLILVDDLIPQKHMKYWLAAQVLVSAAVVKRGHTNTKAGG